jgi:hypothetical protein
MGQIPAELLRSFEPVSIKQIPKDSKGNCTVDLYVFLPTPRRFVIFVTAGERFGPARQAALNRHPVPALFMRAAGEISTPVVEGPATAQDKAYEILGNATTKGLREIFLALNEPSESPKAAIGKLEKLADDIVKVVAPDVGSIKNKMLQNTEYLWVMNEAAALTTIAVTFAAANGIVSAQPLRDLVLACLFMDLPLAKMEEEDMLTYLKNPFTLPPDLRKEYENHSQEAYTMAKNLNYFSEACLQLIRNHHELHNGTGFPRAIRTSTLSPMLGVLSAAVGVFENLKRAQLLEKPTTFHEAIFETLETNLEMHKRRWSKDIIDKVIVFMGLERKET